MNPIILSDKLQVSPVIHGHWRLADWKLSLAELTLLTNQCVEIGVTTFDHADIYGNYTCESIFGNILENNPSLRKNIQLISKCGIKLLTDRFPNQRIKYYDYSYNHIITSVENSLKNLKTDYLDLLLLHRPSPFLNPEEVAEAFNKLEKEGKVLNFGVSNFTPTQFETLDAFLNTKLVTNQVEISPYNLEHFENGNIDFFLKNKIKPLAWSPLAGGTLLQPNNEKSKSIYVALHEISEELGGVSIDTIIYSWLFAHPSTIVPIVGSGKLDRIKAAVAAQKIKLTTEQWFRIYTASTMKNLP